MKNLSKVAKVKTSIPSHKNQPFPKPHPPWCTPPCKEPTRLLEEALDNFQESPDVMICLVCVLLQLIVQLGNNF